MKRLISSVILLTIAHYSYSEPPIAAVNIEIPAFLEPCIKLEPLQQRVFYNQLSQIVKLTTTKEVGHCGCFSMLLAYKSGIIKQATDRSYSCFHIFLDEADG